MNQAGPSSPARLFVEVGAGELIDKITILEIKAERLAEPARLANVLHELAALQAARHAHLGGSSEELSELEAELRTVNLQLWTIEDDIRICEARGDFGPVFVALARAVYLNNDRRAALKRRINVLTRASIVEEKSYADATMAMGKTGYAPPMPSITLPVPPQF